MFISERDSKEVYVKSLERTHAQTVLEHWALKNETSVEFLAGEIRQFPSAGVFLKTNDQLVSWTNYLPCNGLSRIYTLEDYRHRGYDTLMIQYMSKSLAQSGYVPFTRIDPQNDKSILLFKSLGFKWVCEKGLIVVPA